MRRAGFLLPLLPLLAACGGSPASAQQSPFQVEELGRFDEPWAMTFLPGGDLLVTEKRGGLKLRRPDGRVLDVAGVPRVSYGGQGGMGDVVLHPDFARNRLVYLSWVEAGDDGSRGAVVGRARVNFGESLIDVPPSRRRRSGASSRRSTAATISRTASPSALTASSTSAPASASSSHRRRTWP